MRYNIKSNRFRFIIDILISYLGFSLGWALTFAWYDARTGGLFSGLGIFIMIAFVVPVIVLLLLIVFGINILVCKRKHKPKYIKYKLFLFLQFSSISFILWNYWYIHSIYFSETLVLVLSIIINTLSWLLLD